MSANIKVIQIIIMVGISISFLLLSMGYLWPHWWKSVNEAKPEYTLPMYAPIYCIGDVCYNAYVKPQRFFPSPGWIVSGMLFGGVGMFSLLSAIATQAWFMFKGSARITQIVTIIFLATSALVTFISCFIFIDGFSSMSAAYQVQRVEDSLSYNSLPVGLMLLSAVTSSVFSVTSVVSYRSSREEMDLRHTLL